MPTTLNGILQPRTDHIGTLVGSVTTTGTTSGVLCEFDVLPGRLVYVQCELIGAKVGGTKAYTATWYNAFRRGNVGDADSFASVHGQAWLNALVDSEGDIHSFSLVGGGSPNRARFSVTGIVAETWKWSATINLYTTAQE